MGPAFNLNDWENQFRVGGEFDYDLGYGLGITFLSLFGVSDVFRFQMIPGLRVDLLYAGPASFYGSVGMGYGRMSKNNTLDTRTGLGLSLPLGERLELNSDANLFMSPIGTPGFPVTFDWLLALGYKFK